MIWDGTGGKTLEGSLFLPAVGLPATQEKPGESRSRLWIAGGSDLRVLTEKRMRGDSTKIESRPSRENPRREKPEEPPADVVLNTRSTVRDSRKGQSPGAAACHTVPWFRPCDSWQEKRQVGSVGRLMTPATFREGNAPIRDAPKRAVGVKQNRFGLAGSKPARG